MLAVQTYAHMLRRWSSLARQEQCDNQLWPFARLLSGYVTEGMPFLPGLRGL
jgi:hypothetical protein